MTLTYGTIVAQLCRDFEYNYPEVNKQLDKMGYNIGLRLIDDFLAKSNMGRCGNFRETAEVIAKVSPTCLPLECHACDGQDVTRMLPSGRHTEGADG